jgi:hypothetical protein
MSSKKSTDFFQLGIQVGEKVIRATIKALIQCVKWLWQGGTWSHREYVNLRESSTGSPIPWWERIAAAAVILILTIVIVRFGVPLLL